MVNRLQKVQLNNSVNICVSGDAKSREEVQPGINPLKTESQDKTKEVEELKAALDGKKREIEERDKELEEIKFELDEVKMLLEEKSTEADESMEKYCTLMVDVHKLEETNHALTTRLEQITASQRANEANAHSSPAGSTRSRRSGRKSPSKHEEEKMYSDIENTVPLTPQRSPQGSLSGKRGRRDLSDKDSAQEALHNLTKKIKANTVLHPKQEVSRRMSSGQRDFLSWCREVGVGWFSIVTTTRSQEGLLQLVFCAAVYYRVVVLAAWTALPHFYRNRVLFEILYAFGLLRSFFFLKTLVGRNAAVCEISSKNTGADAQKDGSQIKTFKKYHWVWT